MKQYITPDEINQQLSDKARQKLLDWAISHLYLTLQENNLTIGQMIEFLDEHYDQWSCGDTVGNEDAPGKYCFIQGEGYDESDFITHYADELADALFEAVKEILEL